MPALHLQPLPTFTQTRTTTTFHVYGCDDYPMKGLLRVALDLQVRDDCGKKVRSLSAAVTVTLTLTRSSSSFPALPTLLLGSFRLLRLHSVQWVSLVLGTSIPSSVTIAVFIGGVSE
jgi:hypothetical protein